MRSLYESISNSFLMTTESILDNDGQVVKNTKKYLDDVAVVKLFLGFIKVLKFDKLEKVLEKGPDNEYLLIYTIDDRVLDNNINRLKLAANKEFVKKGYDVRDVYIFGKVSVERKSAKDDQNYDFVVQTTAIWSKHSAHLVVRSFLKEELEMLKRMIDKTTNKS